MDTPRPWLEVQHDKHDFSLFAFGGEVAHIEAEEADFAFILRAVNAYDAMRAFILSAPHYDLNSDQIVLYDKARAAILSGDFEANVRPGDIG
jgi:hypothetical protein